MSRARFFLAAMALAAPSGCALVGFDLGDYGGGGDVTPDGSNGDVAAQDGPNGSDGNGDTDGNGTDGNGPDGNGPDGSRDTGGPDGGNDTGNDGGHEVGTDAPVDAPIPDTGVDTGTDSALPPCTVTTKKRVFVSSATYAVTALTLPAADMRCNDLALTFTIEPNFKAWLSDDTASAASRIAHGTTDAYVLVDVASTVVACNWAELVSLPHRHAIDLNESGALAPTSPTCGGVADRAVFTGTNPDGSIATGKTCSGWTSTGGTTTMGYSRASDATWTQGCATGSCNQVGAIYCIEQ